jgi:molybdate transport system substrate-binding protein
MSGPSGSMRIAHMWAFVALMMCHAIGARADEVTLIAPGGIRGAIVQLIPGFERLTGHTVKATFGSGGGTKQQVARGEPFDVPIVQPPYPEVLASGHVVVESATPLATVWVGVAVRKGAPKPDISTPEAVKRMLLGARAIAYPDASGGAAAGVSFNETLRKLGIADAMKPKIKPAQGGAGAMALLAKGEIDIGLTFLSEMTDPGIDVVGPLPKEISTPTALVGFLSAHAKAPEAGKALLRYLSSPEAAAVYRANGMQPGDGLISRRFARRRPPIRRALEPSAVVDDGRNLRKHDAGRVVDVVASALQQRHSVR